MVYLLGKKILNNLLISQGLIKIYGIGNNNAEKICRHFGFLKKIRVKDLTQNDWSNILKYIRKQKIKIEKDLKKKLKFNISNLINIRNYRGLRHFKGLPVRGQRSHSNSKTQKKLYKGRSNQRNFSTNSLISGFFNDSNFSYSLNKRISIFKNWKFTKKKWYTSFQKCLKKYFKKQKFYNINIEKLNKGGVNIYKNNSNKINNLKKKNLFYSKNPKKTFTKILTLFKTNQNSKNRTKEFLIRKKINNISKNNSFLDVNFHLYQFSEITLYINIKYSNLFIFAYDESGKLLCWSSGGSLKLKGKQQGSRYAGKVVTDLILLKLNELKVKYLRLIIKGKGPARRAAIQNIRKKKTFFLTQIINTTPIAYNGCRLKKIKR